MEYLACFKERRVGGNPGTPRIESWGKEMVTCSGGGVRMVLIVCVISPFLRMLVSTIKSFLAEDQQVPPGTPLLRSVTFEFKCALCSPYTATSATAASILIAVTSRLSSSSSSSSATMGTQDEGRHVAWLLLLLAGLVSGLLPALA